MDFWHFFDFDGILRPSNIQELYMAVSLKKLGIPQNSMELGAK